MGVWLLDQGSGAAVGCRLLLDLLSVLSQWVWLEKGLRYKSIDYFKVSLQSRSNLKGESKRYQEHQPGQYTAATNILPLLRHLLDDVDNDVYGDDDHDAVYEFLVLIMLGIMKIRVK